MEAKWIRRSGIVLCILSGWLGSARALPALAANDYVYNHENVMGTSLELRVMADHAEAARWAEQRVLRELDRLTDVFSGYESASEFSRWQSSNGPVRISDELFDVLRASDEWKRRTAGVFDPRVQALSSLWSSAAARNQPPTAEEVVQTRALMTRPAWRLDGDARTAERLSDCPLSLNGIAKGYAVERACSLALDRSRGVRGVLLNLGGDLRVCGEIVRTIGIADPRADSETTEPIAHFEVSGCAVATSGKSQRGFRIKGEWYSHVFDPRSGLPAEGTASATVVAERSVDADVLAKVFNVLSPGESVRLARSIPGVECLIVASDGRISRSDGWRRLERRRPVRIALADDPKAPPKAKQADKAGKKEKAPPRDPWAGEMELVVNFEINRPADQARGYRRPYVAVWVEDKSGFPVRNVSLWVSFGGAGPYQWIPEMKRWFKSDDLRKDVDKTDMIQTIARPTRPPGKYSVIWDGKDDHGNPLDRGEYNLFIDAAREHGTYQSIRTQVNLAHKPFAEELKGNVEIKSASVEYRRKTPAK